MCCQSNVTAMTAQPPKNFTSGDIVRWRRVGGLVLAEVEYEAGQRVHRHQHPHARFVLVLRGSMTETRGGEETDTYGASTLLFRRGDEPHSFHASPSGATCLIVDMDPSWLARAREHAPLLARSTALRGGLVLHLAQRLYGEFRLRDDVSRLAIESLALGVLAEASRRVSRAADRLPAWLQLALMLIEQHFTEPLPLAVVARRVGVHPVHLARTFRRVYRTTFAAYVRQLRIDFARRELAGAAALSDIACAAGFCDQSHFTRCFKRDTGLTPAEYRLALHVR
jgi:AraC family transcriptional regulator